MSLSEDDLAAILSSYDAAEPGVAAAEPEASERYASTWLYDEIDSVYHAPLNRCLYPQPHEEICGILEEAIGDCRFGSGGQRMVMIGVPRGSNKSTIAAENLPPVILTRNPNARILIDAFRHDVAQKRLRAARWHFESNATWRAKYGPDWVPQFRELPWSDTAMTVTRRTLPLIEPSIEASGTDRSATGSHFDVIISDDLVNDINCRTKEQRDKVYDHILDQQAILEPNGVYILIFTTWDPDDAYARFMKIDDDRVRNGQKPFWKRIIRSCYDGPEGLYYPTRFTHAILDDLRAKMGSRKFSAQFLLKPIAPEDKTFNMDIARVVPFSFEPRQYGGMVTIPRWAYERVPVTTTLFWDPAGPKAGGKRSDEHGLTVVGCDPLDRWWVLEAEGVKALASEVIDRVIRLVLYYHVGTLGYEDEGMQELWVRSLQHELDARQIASPAFVGVSGHGVPKNERIELALQPRWERGGIILQPSQNALFSQINTFSPANTAHEDILDSLAGHSTIARPAAPEFAHLRTENPVDPAWLKRRERLAAETGRAEDGIGFGSAGMHSTGYDSGPPVW